MHPENLNWEAKFINALFNLTIDANGKRRNKDGAPAVISYEKPFDEIVEKLQNKGWVCRIVAPLKKGKTYDQPRDFHRAVCMTEKGIEEISKLRGRYPF